MRLDGLEPVRAAAVIAQADGYAGTYGSESYVAALLGRPAVAVRPADDPPADRDLRLASYFLGRPPFGSLDAVTDVALRVRRWRGCSSRRPRPLR